MAELSAPAPVPAAVPAPAPTPPKWLVWVVGENNAKKLTTLNARELLVGLALGQFVSFLITSTGFTSSELALKGVDAPTSQSFLNYFLLAIIYGGIMIWRRKAIKIKWYYYIIFAIIDVEANYIVVKAYQYTSLTSVMLLDCWSIPCVIIMTWIFLKTNYNLRKFIGVAICVGGLVLVVFSDAFSSGRARGPAPLKGDLFVFAGATLYAVSNVTEEFLVKRTDRIEVMALLGVFGTIISAIQIAILERHELRSINWNAGAVLPFLGFALALFLFYSLVPTILKICGSTMLNLSLLTSDMWAVIIQIFAYHQKVDWMYFVAFGGTATGLVIYSYKTKKERAKSAQVAEGGDDQVKELDEEAAVENQRTDSGAADSGPSIEIVQEVSMTTSSSTK